MGAREIFAQTTIDAYHLVRRTSVDVGAQFIAPWWHTTPSQAGAMNCAPTSITTHHAKIDPVGEWYYGRQRRMQHRFYPILHLLSCPLERKMTFVVPVIPFANRVKIVRTPS